MNKKEQKEMLEQLTSSHLQNQKLRNELKDIGEIILFSKNKNWFSRHILNSNYGSHAVHSDFSFIDFRGEVGDFGGKERGDLFSTFLLMEIMIDQIVVVALTDFKDKKKVVYAKDIFQKKNISEKIKFLKKHNILDIDKDSDSEKFFEIFNKIKDLRNFLAHKYYIHEASYGTGKRISMKIENDNENFIKYHTSSSELNIDINFINNILANHIINHQSKILQYLSKFIN